MSIPLPMNSATHMNTLPVRANLFGKNTNATIHTTYTVLQACQLDSQHKRAAY